MRHGTLVFLYALAAVFVATAGGCSAVGESEVHVETGNQTSGFLTRPLMLTASSDDSVRQVAQRICDNVKPGSSAAIAFVGKVPGPGPINVADWGKYRYDCTVDASARTVVTAPAAAAPAAPATSALAPTPPPATSSAAPAAVPLAPLTEAQEQHRRECQRRLGTYQICMGSCLASSSSPSGVVEAECAQRCAPQSPLGCN